MKIQLASGIKGNWAKVGEDIKDGDRVKIMNGGVEDTTGQWGPKLTFKVLTTKKEEFIVNLNRTSQNTLGRGWGTETEDWVGKVAKAFVVKQMVSDGLKKVLYLAPEGWEMNDDGEFFNPNETETSDEPMKHEPNPDDIPF